MTTVGLATLALAAAAPAAFGDDDGDVERTARCSKGSLVSLDLSPKRGAVEVEVEVDEGRRGSKWSVVANRNGRRIITRTAITRGEDGSLEVRRIVTPGRPRTTVTAVARRAATGEVCRVSVTL